MKKMRKYKLKIQYYLQKFNLLDVFMTLSFIGSLLLKAFYFQFTTKLNKRPFLMQINNMMVLSNLGVILVIVGIIILIFKRRRNGGLLAVNLIISFLLLSDTLYYRYYYSAISITSIYQLGIIGSIGDSIVSFFRIKDIIYIIDFPIILLGFFILRNKGNKDPIYIKERGKKFLLATVIGVLLINIALKNTDTSTFSFDNNYIIRHGGVGYYHYYDVREFVKNNYLRNKKLTKGEQGDLNEYFSNKVETGNNLKGISKDKNLIIVQVEALQEFIINAKTPAGEEITPYLNKLIKESQYFDNLYVQVGAGNTSDAELMTNASIYPAKEGAAYFLYPTNTYDSLGGILKERGYNTYVSHPNNPTFWNRGVMYNALKFDEFYSNQKFVLDEYVGWGLGDTSLYIQTIDKMNTDDPFYSFIISLSSHYPFKYEYFENYEFDVGKYEDSFLGYYMKATNYADKALASMIQKLKDENIYEDSLIVIYGDHTAVPRDKSEELMEYLALENTDLEWLRLQKIPLIIHDPEIKDHKINSNIGGQIDILPTIANLMDFKLPYGFGKDLLNTKESYAIFRNSTIVTDKYYYLSNDGKVYDAKTDLEIQDNRHEEEIEGHHYELYISDTVLKKDAIEKIEK